MNYSTHVTFALHHTYDRAGRVELFETYEQAETAAREIWKHAEIGHDGDITEGGECTLIWASAEEAENDDGSRAVASIKVRRP